MYKLAIYVFLTILFPFESMAASSTQYCQKHCALKACGDPFTYAQCAILKCPITKEQNCQNAYREKMCHPKAAENGREQAEWKIISKTHPTLGDFFEFLCNDSTIPNFYYASIVNEFYGLNEDILHVNRRGQNIALTIPLDQYANFVNFIFEHVFNITPTCSDCNRFTCKTHEKFYACAAGCQHTLPQKHPNCVASYCDKYCDKKKEAPEDLYSDARLTTCLAFCHGKFNQRYFDHMMADVARILGDKKYYQSKVPQHKKPKKEKTHYTEEEDDDLRIQIAPQPRIHRARHSPEPKHHVYGWSIQAQQQYKKR